MLDAIGGNVLNTGAQGQDQAERKLAEQQQKDMPEQQQKDMPDQKGQQQKEQGQQQEQKQQQEQQQKEQEQGQQAPGKSGKGGSEGAQGTEGGGGEAAPAIDVNALNSQMEQGGLRCDGQGNVITLTKAGQLTLPGGAVQSLSAEQLTDIQNSVDQIFASSSFGTVNCEQSASLSDNESLKATDSNGQSHILYAADQGGGQRCFRGEAADIDRLKQALQGLAQANPADNAGGDAGNNAGSNPNAPADSGAGNQ